MDLETECDRWASLFPIFCIREVSLKSKTKAIKTDIQARLDGTYLESIPLFRSPRITPNDLLY